MSGRHTQKLMAEFNQWGYDERGWAARTRHKYAWTAKRADQWLVSHRDTSLLWARPKDLQAYLFSTKPAARNRNAVRQALVGFGEFLVDRGLQEVNPAVGLPRLPEPRSLPVPIEPEGVRRILAVLPAFEPPVRAAILLMLYGGLRREEVRRLRWADVTADWIRFTAKGNRQRSVKLHRRVAEALAVLRSQSTSADWVFPSPLPHRHGPVGDTAVWRWVKDVGDVAGLDVHPHQLRHTFATALYEQTGDVHLVQEALGHADPKTTTVYAKVRPVRLAEEISRLSYD